MSGATTDEHGWTRIGVGEVQHPKSVGGGSGSEDRESVSIRVNPWLAFRFGALNRKNELPRAEFQQENTKKAGKQELARVVPGFLLGCDGFGGLGLAMALASAAEATAGGRRAREGGAQYSIFNNQWSIFQW